MNSTLKFGTLLFLLASSILILGQGEGGAGCGFMNNGGDGPDPLAPLVEDPDPLAPLVPDTPADPRWPRGLCALWSGKLNGTRLHNSTIETGCPWDDGTIDLERTVTQEQHVSDFQLTFKDAWAADNWGTICAPNGAGASPISVTGSVTYTYSFEYDHDWGDSCRSHRTTHDDYFSFGMSPELLAVYVEVYPEPFSAEAQDAMLAERPCRSEYPVRVTIILSAPDAGGAGTHSWYDRSTDICPACDGCPVPGSVEDTGSEQVSENAAAGYRAYLYGTYRIDSAGRDTIVAKYQGVTTVNSAQSGEGDCAGVNDACNCQAEDDVADDFTLTLTRHPENDRDMDMLCDSVDPCPDAPFSEDCSQ